MWRQWLKLSLLRRNWFRGRWRFVWGPNKETNLVSFSISFSNWQYQIGNYVFKVFTQQIIHRLYQYHFTWNRFINFQSFKSFFSKRNSWFIIKHDFNLEGNDQRYALQWRWKMRVSLSSREILWERWMSRRVYSHHTLSFFPVITCWWKDDSGMERSWIWY